MSTSVRKRKSADLGRMALALKSPGIDPRTWVATARVEMDPESFRWDHELGWIVDVTIYGGPLDQQSSIPCRVVGGSGLGAGEFLPPGADVEAVMTLPSGDVDDPPVIVGTVTNATMPPPATVNGLPIAAVSTPIPSTPTSVSPFDTEIKVTPHGRREQFGGAVHQQSPARVVETDEPLDSLKLGSRDADQHLPRGEDLCEAVTKAFETAVTSGAIICAAPSSPATLSPTWAVPGSGRDVFKAALLAALSRKILAE